MTRFVPVPERRLRRVLGIGSAFAGLERSLSAAIGRHDPRRALVSARGHLRIARANFLEKR